MKPRGLKGLLSKQSNNPTGAPAKTADQSGMRLGALTGPGASGSDKPDQGKTGHQMPNRSPKRSTAAAKSSAAAPRRTAPGG